jgi:hypothetical protein
MKDNKLIAEFMDYIKGFDIIDDNKYQGEITLSNNLMEEQIDGEISHFEDRYGVTPIAKESELQYHKSWDWLMPVVEKIESDERYDVDILQYGTRITEGGREGKKDIVNNIADISFDKKIEHTYDAVVEFIIDSYLLPF